MGFGGLSQEVSEETKILSGTQLEAIHLYPDKESGCVLLLSKSLNKPEYKRNAPICLAVEISEKDNNEVLLLLLISLIHIYNEGKL